LENSLRQQQLEENSSTHSEEFYKGKIITVRCDTVQFDEHPPHKWDIVSHPGAAAVLPITEKGNLLLILQWRRAIKKIIYEICAGTLEENEPPLECAKREIQEEVGFKAKHYLSLGGVYSAPGFCDEYIHLFLAKDLTPSSMPGDLHEAIDVIEVNLNKALDLIDSNEIQDMKTITAILRYQRLIQKNPL